MKLHYDAETDSLYIDLSERKGADAIEVVPGVVIDLGADGEIVGIDIQRASKVVDLERLEITELPSRHVSVG